MKIEGKTSVVIGGARGIGRAYCEALLTKGANVGILTISVCTLFFLIYVNSR